MFPVSLVLGEERSRVSQEVLEAADIVVAIPMLGMANSLNVATAAAILLNWLSVGFEEGTRISRIADSGCTCSRVVLHYSRASWVPTPAVSSKRAWSEFGKTSWL